MLKTLSQRVEYWTLLKTLQQCWKFRESQKENSKWAFLISSKHQGNTTLEMTFSELFLASNNEIKFFLCHIINLVKFIGVSKAVLFTDIKCIETIFCPNISYARQPISQLKINCNHAHNTMRTFDSLPNCPFTTSETKPDHY